MERETFSLKMLKNEGDLHFESLLLVSLSSTGAVKQAQTKIIITKIRVNKCFILKGS